MRKSQRTTLSQQCVDSTSTFFIQINLFFLFSKNYLNYSYSVMNKPEKTITKRARKIKFKEKSTFTASNWRESIDEKVKHENVQHHNECDTYNG